VESKRRADQVLLFGGYTASAYNGETALAARFLTWYRTYLPLAAR
jgi:hypothetical protein